MEFANTCCKSYSSIISKALISCIVKVRANWGNNIRKESWGQTVRARINIAFRKRFHRNPNATMTELANAVENEGKNVTSDEIIRVYNRGKERIAVWTMEYVGYDEMFQREIHEKFQNSIV
ncbi:hypothetical protein PILCRDRAFT_828800 [Piloderma croceum F 1598]|uniref:DUF6697 domain-containing protein n=1 Tax=Piloderma croceum (strain F 1598) TaxID=765440 RepID=A0A0C3F1D3_PILCF|nr:hypothetical protein PILCRDRAFT_828800 [Piloderma croceum F 1598]